MKLKDYMKKNGIGRTGMWIRKNFHYKRMKNVEIESESIIAIKIGYPKKEKIQHHILLYTVE